MENKPGVNVAPTYRSRDELRAEIFRVLDELVVARADRAAVLSANFKALWSELFGGAAPTVH